VALWVLALGLYVALAVVVASSEAAVVEAQVHAERDGWAKLRAEGVLVVGCTAESAGRCEWQTGEGLSATTRRVRVRKGANRIRLKAQRFESVPAERLDYGWLLSSDPDDVPDEAAVPTEPAQFNMAYVTGRVAGRKIEPMVIKVR
jgi:hypothetical protein